MFRSPATKKKKKGKIASPRVRPNNPTRPGLTSVSNPLFRMNALLSSGQGTQKAWDSTSSNLSIQVPVLPATPRTQLRQKKQKFQVVLTPLQEQVFSFEYQSKLKFKTHRRSHSTPFYNTWNIGSNKAKAANSEFLSSSKNKLACLRKSTSFDSIPPDTAVTFLKQVSKNIIKADESIPIHLEVVDDGEEVVVDGTLNQLVAYSTNPAAVQSKDFVDTLLFSHRYFTKSVVLFQKLVERYSTSFSGEEDEATQQRNSLMVKLRVINVMKKWIEHPFHCFYENKQLKLALAEFTSKLGFAGGKEGDWAKHLSNTLQETTELANQKVATVATPTAPQFKFLDLDPEYFAQQMTLYDAQMFRRIKATEIFHTAWVRADKEETSPNIMALTERFNRVSFWCATQIVQAEKLSQRVEVLKNLILLGDHLLEMGNFHGVMEIYAALNMGSIQRLKLTWKELPSKYSKKMQEISNVLDATGNFRNLREAVKKQAPPIVPFQGVFLGDLTTFEEIPDRLDNGRINFEKMRLLAKVFSQITITQVMPYTFPANNKIQSFLSHLQPISEADLYKLSKELEATNAAPAARTRSGSLWGNKKKDKAEKKAEKAEKKAEKADKKAAKLKNKHLAPVMKEGKRDRRNTVS